VQPEALQQAARHGPSDAPVATEGRRSPPGIEQAQQEGTLVLVVDDHPVNRMLLLQQVNTLGYAAQTANDGLQALEAWKTQRFGLVITDCNMPNLDGYELARRIRALETGSGKRVPIIACTANAMRGEAEKCLAAGMDDFLGKPIELSQLLKKLDEWLPVAGAGEAPPPVSGPRPIATLPAQPPAAAASGPVDLALIAETFGDDPSGVAGILSALRTSNEQDAQVLRQALEAKDLKQLAYAAHRMYGAGEMLGARDFSSACQALARGSRAGDWQAIGAAMTAFDAQWLRLKNYLDAV
jgi:CheY-like chemotaxis protein